VQKKGESLQEFIHRFCNKRNVIPEVNDKSIIMFFKKGLRDSSLIRKLTVKNPRTLDNRDTKKDKELSQSDQPDTSKNNYKKRILDRSMTNVEPPHCNRTKYQPRLGEFEGFLDRIYIFHP
jgi:hypothetical protein